MLVVTRPVKRKGTATILNNLTIMITTIMIIKPSNQRFFFSDPIEAELQHAPEQAVSQICYCGRKAKSRSERFCVSTEKSRCPCVSNKKKCQAQCKCRNCDNRSQNPQKLSCRCEESRAKGRKTGQTSCIDVSGQRRTKCPCYSNGKPCSILCSCFNCENRYGIRVTHSTDDCKAEKKKRITSTPPSLKRRRTAAILEEEGSDLQPGPWTLEESCLLDSVESFILNTCVIPSYRNISILFNFVSKSLRGNNTHFTVTSKTERQIQGKLEFVRKKHLALKNLYYGISVLDNQGNSD